jgi:Protein of unknown function (DUF3108)
MMPPVMRPLSALAALLLFCAWPMRLAQAADAASEPATAAPALAPFVASYEAQYRGKPAGNATLQLVHEQAPQWRVDLGIEGRRGMAGVLGLNVQQSTAFNVVGGAYRPLGQSTVRKGLFLGRKTVGTYDWANLSARWQGDVKKRHRQPVALQPGDMSGLLINLAIVRDARPGAVLRYRFVEGGRVRDHVYHVASAPETIGVGELSYSALRVARSNGGNDDTVVWVAEGVPTPVRILQREDGEDAVDLRLIEYK